MNVRVAFVPVSTRLSEAPAITAPPASVMVPFSVPVPNWPWAKILSARTKAKEKRLP